MKDSDLRKLIDETVAQKVNAALANHELAFRLVRATDREGWRAALKYLAAEMTKCKTPTPTPEPTPAPRFQLGDWVQHGEETPLQIVDSIFFCGPSPEDYWHLVPPKPACPTGRELDGCRLPRKGDAFRTAHSCGTVQYDSTSDVDWDGSEPPIKFGGRRWIYKRIPVPQDPPRPTKEQLRQDGKVYRVVGEKPRLYKKGDLFFAPEIEEVILSGYDGNKRVWIVEEVVPRRWKGHMHQSVTVPSMFYFYASENCGKDGNIPVDAVERVE